MLLPSCSTNDEECALINHMSQLPRHFEMVPKGIELGCAWPDIMIAAALLTRTQYWGNSERERLAGITREFPPATLGSITRKINPLTKEAFVVFLILGDTTHLRTLRWYWSIGCLMFPSHPDRKKQLYMLTNEYNKACERAREMKEGINVRTQ